MTRGRLTAISVFGIGIVVVIAGFFLLRLAHTALNFWALGALVFALLVALLVTLMLVAPKPGQSVLFSTAALSSVLWIYLVAVVASVAASHLFVNHVSAFVFVELAINALFLIIALIVVNLSKHAAESDARTYAKQQSGQFNQPTRGGF